MLKYVVWFPPLPSAVLALAWAAEAGVCPRSRSRAFPAMNVGGWGGGVGSKVKTLRIMGYCETQLLLRVFLPARLLFNGDVVMTLRSCVLCQGLDQLYSQLLTQVEASGQAFERSAIATSLHIPPELFMHQVGDRSRRGAAYFSYMLSCSPRPTRTFTLPRPPVTCCHHARCATPKTHTI